MHSLCLSKQTNEKRELGEKPIRKPQTANIFFPVNKRSKNKYMKVIF